MPITRANPRPLDDTETATARVTILMTPTEKGALFNKAKREGFDSVGAYLRRKAFDGENVGVAAILSDLRTRMGRIERSLATIANQLAPRNTKGHKGE